MPTRQFTSATALRIGDAVGVDWSRTNVEDFRRALGAEAATLPGDEEDDEVLAGRLAWAALQRRRA